MHGVPREDRCGEVPSSRSTGPLLRLPDNTEGHINRQEPGAPLGVLAPARAEAPVWPGVPSSRSPLFCAANSVPESCGTSECCFQCQCMPRWPSSSTHAVVCTEQWDARGSCSTQSIETLRLIMGMWTMHYRPTSTRNTWDKMGRKI
jgi:hypothetical protein